MVHFGDLLVLGVDGSDDICADIDAANEGTEITPERMKELLEGDFDPDDYEMVLVVRIERIYTKTGTPFVQTEGKGMDDN